MSITTSPDPDLLVGRIFDSLNGAMELFTIYVGDQLGFYRLLHENGPLTSEQLASLGHTQERSTREWLEQQAVAGYLVVDHDAADPSDRVFRLPQEYVGVLVEDEDQAWRGL